MIKASRSELLTIFMFVTILGYNQVTPEQASVIDAQYASYLIAGVYQQNGNYPLATYTSTSGIGITIEVAGDGYFPEANARIGWGHNTPTEVVDSINIPPSQNFNSYYLEEIPNVQAYEDSLEYYFLTHGILTNIYNKPDNQSINFISTNSKGFWVKTRNINGMLTLEIINLTGNVITQKQMDAFARKNFYFLYPEIKSGIYILRANNNIHCYSEKVFIK